MDSEKQLETIKENWSELKDYHREILTQMSSVIKVIGPFASRVLLTIAERLALGARNYPQDDFCSVERDWVEEDLQERLDSNIYQTVDYLKFKDARQKQG